jgi:CHRD domain
MKKLILAAILASLAVQTQASTVFFDLVGKGGTGLLAGNQNGTVNGTPGTGGEVGAGIFYDDVANLLTINVAWGSANGFANLTGNTTAGHLHGPTASGGTAGYTQDASPKYFLNSLAGWNNSASAGGYSGTISILDTDETALLNGQFYFNAHTALNGGGEIRGTLVVVPEPSMVSFIVIGAALPLLRLRRKVAA